jgi:MtN3 and saliva related transmembrane protein
MREIVGWTASVILLATIVSQIVRQWREGTSKGVSRWLFIGQVAASLGFTIYSVLVQNYVFIVTNALMLLSALVGLGIVLHHRKRGGNE